MESEIFFGGGGGERRSNVWTRKSSIPSRDQTILLIESVSKRQGNHFTRQIGQICGTCSTGGGGGSGHDRKITHTTGQCAGVGGTQPLITEVSIG